MKLHPKVKPKDELEAILNECIKNRRGSTFVIFIDGNGIKAINDKFGHLTGDFVIERLAYNLAEGIRDSDHIVRFGGDEFVLILNQFNRENIKSFAKNLQKSVRTDKELITRVGGINISMGVVEYQHGYHNYKKVLEEADLLMYHAKNNTAPEYMAFSCDIAKVDKTPAKIMSISEKRKRAYLACVVDIVLSENPDFDLDILSKISEELFSINGNRLLNNLCPNQVINTLTRLCRTEMKRKERMAG